MNNQASPQGSVWIGLIVALTIGSLIVGSSILPALITGSKVDLSEEWGIFLFQGLLVSGPFILLALARVRVRRAWVTGILVTLAFWAAYVASAWMGEGGGVNIGMALLMLASPIFVSVASFLASGTWSGRS